MDNLTAVAASGMRSRMQALEILANNIANGSSRGYKADREVYNIYSAENGSNPPASSVQQQPWIKGSWTDFAQGILEPTGNPLDVGLVGQGFLTVRGPAGNFYTRNGSLRVSAKGDLLAAEDRPVLDSKSQPIHLDPGRPFEISGDGELKQDGQTIARLGLVEFPNPAALAKVGQSYFRPNDGSNASAPAKSTEVRQGHIETSNSVPSEAAVRLVSVLRQFEMLQKAIALGTEMNRRAFEEVAKVNP